QRDAGDGSFCHIPRMIWRVAEGGSEIATVTEHVNELMKNVAREKTDKGQNRFPRPILSSLRSFS
ncbi:MAG: hypothetical protein J6T47_09255, partial [Lachnospiraceae bacterium]|nr:hypothetical protein [Lachnospiraceae bacterium]